MSIFSLILIGYIIVKMIVLFFRKEDFFSFFLTLFIFCSVFLDVGKVISVGKYDFDYSEFSLTLFFLCCVFYRVSGKLFLSRGSVFLFCLIEIVMVFGLLFRFYSDQVVLGIDHSLIADDVFLRGASLVNVKVTWYSIITFVKISMFLYSIICTYSFLDKSIFSHIMRRMAKISKIFILFGFFEFVFINVINPMLLRKIILYILGTSKSMVIVPYFRAGIYSVLLTYMEPSSVCFGLFIMVGFLLFDYCVCHDSNNRKRDALFVCLACLLSLFTLAITGLLTSFIVLLLIIIHCCKNKNPFPLFLLSALAICMIVLLFIDNPISSYLNTRMNVLKQFIAYYRESPMSPNVFSFHESLVYRTYSIFNAASIFFRFPFFGIGTGTATSFSGLFYTLSNVGVLGLALDLALWNRFTKKYAICKNGVISILLLVFYFVFYGSINNFLCSISSYCVLVGFSSYIYCRNGKKNILFSRQSPKGFVYETSN